MYRIAFGGIMHESNTFNNISTEFDAFSYTIGDDIFSVWKDSHHEVGGFIQGLEEQGYIPYSTLMATATPAGPLTDDAFDKLTNMLIQELKAIPNLDGLLLALHGAMVVESFPDADGEVLRRLREIYGQSFPIVVTLDHHANVSEQMVDQSTALIIYKTNPHIDQRQRGKQATELMLRILKEEIHPIQALAKPPMILNILHQNTSAEPMSSIINMANQMENNDNVLVANVAAGYPYADVSEIGPSFVVMTDNNQELAQTHADQLSDMLWNSRDQLTLNLPDASCAVHKTIYSDKHPVILVEMGDNIGGGSPGDSTIIFEELMKQKASEFVVVLYDPECVETCIKSGVGNEISLQVGGKTDRLHGNPVAITGKIRMIHDGHFVESEPRHGGQKYHNQGLTAVVAVGDSLIVLTSNRQTPFSLQQLLSLGINPVETHIIVVKAAIAYRAAYEPIADKIIEVDTPGLTAVNPQHFSYQNVRRPIFPLD